MKSDRCLFGVTAVLGILVGVGVARADDVETSPSMGGLIRSRLELISNDTGTTEKVRYRALYKFSRAFEAGPLAVSAHITPQAGGFMGVGGDDLNDMALGLHEGFVRAQGERLQLDVGRFEMAYGDQLVIGPVGWHHIGRAFDGARARVALGQGDAWLDLFGTWLNSASVSGLEVEPAFGAGDGFFLGAYAGLGPLVSRGLGLDGYVFERLTPDATIDGVDTTGVKETTVGARAKGVAGMLDYRAEAGAQLGSRGDMAARGIQVDAELGAGLLSDGRLRLGLEAFYASGDEPTTVDIDESWFQLYPTAHKWLGFTDIMGGRSNVMGGVFHVKSKISDPLTVTLDCHSFLRPQVADGADSYAGSEADFGVVRSWSRTFRMRLAYNLFIFPASIDIAPHHFVEVELLTKF